MREDGGEDSKLGHLGSLVYSQKSLVCWVEKSPSILLKFIPNEGVVVIIKVRDAQPGVGRVKGVIVAEFVPLELKANIR